MPSVEDYRIADRIIQSRRDWLNNAAEQAAAEMKDADYHRRLDAEIEEQVAADLEQAEVMFLAWFNERAELRAFDPDYFEKLRECDDQLDYWSDLAAIAN